MKKFFTTRENWLLIIPIFFWLLENTVIKSPVLDLHLHDTYFVIGNVSFVMLYMSLIPFLCHVALRVKNNGNKKLLGTHVLISCLCLIALYAFLLYQSWSNSNGMSGMPRRYYDYSTWDESTEGLNFVMTGIILSIMLYVLLQLWLLLYTVFKLFSKSNTKSL